MLDAPLFGVAESDGELPGAAPRVLFGLDALCPLLLLLLPFCPLGGSRREQGLSKNGNPRVRRILTQLMWRWLIFQPQSALAQWCLKVKQRRADSAIRR